MNGLTPLDLIIVYIGRLIFSVVCLLFTFIFYKLYCLNCLITTLNDLKFLIKVFGLDN